jgi:hypothetical protein
MFLEERYGNIGRSVHETKLTLDSFVNQKREPEVYNFYKSLGYQYKTNEYTEEVLGRMEKNAQDNVLKYRGAVEQMMIRDLTIARGNYEKEMFFIHGKKVGTVTLAPAPAPMNRS